MSISLPHRGDAAAGNRHITVSQRPGAGRHRQDQGIIDEAVVGGRSHKVR